MHKMIQSMIAAKLNRICCFNFREVTTQAAGKVLEDTQQTGSSAANDGVKNASFFCWKCFNKKGSPSVSWLMFLTEFWPMEPVALVREPIFSVRRVLQKVHKPDLELL